MGDRVALGHDRQGRLPAAQITAVGMKKLQWRSWMLIAKVAFLNFAVERA